MGVTLDRVLTIAGVLIECAFFALLTRKRAYRMLPVFYAYVALGACSDTCMLLLQSRLPYARYLQMYLVDSSLDSAVQFGVLVELIWSVLRPLGVSLRRLTPIAIGVALLMVVLVIWPFSESTSFLALQPISHSIARLQATLAILRILVFLTMAAGSHFLSIGWRDRELQVATGLGTYSLFSFAASLIHTHQPAFHLIDLLVSASYISALLYWIVCFALPEKSRRVFTPQMHDTLFALASSARAHRATLSSSASASRRAKL